MWKTAVVGTYPATRRAGALIYEQRVGPNGLHLSGPIGLIWQQIAAMITYQAHSRQNQIMHLARHAWGSLVRAVLKILKDP